jgi:hypothetical protein
VPNPKLFIGSSSTNSRVARLIASRLESGGCGNVTVWDEGIFGLSQGVLDRLTSTVNEFDFAILIWAPDDNTDSKGVSMASPRDNVIFECGLFMGAIGRDRVFIVCDKSKEVKIPSDFAGISLAHYDGCRVNGDEGLSAVRDACDQIALEIRRPRYPEFVGEWRSRYAKAADPDHGEVIDDLDIRAAPGGIRFTSKPLPTAEPYTACGRIYNNQVIGKWEHQTGHTFAEGLFILVVNPLANVMYGYCSGRDENGTMIYETWVLAKKTGISENKVNELLLWGEKALKGHTVLLPLPEFDKTKE